MITEFQAMIGLMTEIEGPVISDQLGIRMTGFLGQVVQHVSGL